MNMNPFQDRPRTGVLNEPLPPGTTSFVRSVRVPDNFALFTDQLGPFPLQSLQQQTTECAAQPEAKSTDTAPEPQGSGLRPFASHHSLKPDTGSVGPWVVSNRKVQRRYREKQKAEKQSMEQQLEALTLQLDDMKANNAEAANHNSTLEKAIALKDYEVAKLQESNHVMDTASLPGADLKASLHNIVSIRSSTKPHVIQEYKQLVKHMVGLLLILGREGSSPAVTQDLASAASSLVLLFMRTFIFSAHDAARLMKANLEYDHYEAAPASSPQEDPKQLWQAVTDKLELQPEQRRHMISLRQHFLQSLRECHDSREAICLGLQQGTQKVQTAYDTIETDAQAYVLSMLELHHESSQLRNNLRKQHRIWMDFYATVFRVSPSISTLLHSWCATALIMAV
ncbi:hypothetical protein ABBQ32_009825 [Trebouxia sp. C0010 RCD-2024]